MTKKKTFINYVIKTVNPTSTITNLSDFDDKLIEKRDWFFCKWKHVLPSNFYKNHWSSTNVTPTSDPEFVEVTKFRTTWDYSLTTENFVITNDLFS